MTREEAVDILDDNFTVIETHGHYTDDEVEQARQMAISALEQQKTGHWIWNDGVWKFMCSVCKESVNPMPTCMGKPLMKYCPNCGVKMEV